MSIRVTTRFFSLAVLVCCLAPSDPAIAREEVPDVAPLSAESLGIELPAEKKDTKTGFLVAGKNRTQLIRGLESINGRSVRELEAIMRPGGPSINEEGSDDGFLGKDERLLGVMAADNDFVLDECGLTHQELARPMLWLGYYASRNRGTNRVKYGELDLQVSAVLSRGFQNSPFRDGTKTNADITVENLQNGKKLSYSLLVPIMVHRYGFYEGKGTPYRVEPRQVIEVFQLKKTTTSRTSRGDGSTTTGPARSRP